MLDLIAVGNIAADLYFSAEQLTTKNDRFFLSQGKYFSQRFYFKIGGGAANVAIGTKKNGLKSNVCGIVGNNAFRKNILHTLKLKGIPTNLLIFRQDYINVSTILLKENGERTIINHETPHEHLSEEKSFLKRLRKARAIYFGNLPDVALSERTKIINDLHKKGVFVFANIGSRDCCRPKKYTRKFLEKIDALILNGYEFSELVKKPYAKLNFKTNMIRYLPVMKEKILIITDSKKGSYGYLNGKVYYQRALEPGKIVDTTGAGDAYTAGFIAGYLKSDDIEIAMKRGAQYASRILAKIGAN